MREKTGIIDVGGGLRGAYAAGILDYCLDHEITFDLGIGVSAGSANLASFTAKQPRRNYRFYTEFAMRKEYMGMGNFLKTGSFIGLDYIYGTLSNSGGESPVDYLSFHKNPMEMIVVATEAKTGKGTYFTKKDIHWNNYDVLKASCAIPYVCKPYFIQGIPYYDGALADPVPVQKAFELGCDKVVLILTLPENQIRQPGKDLKLAKGIKRKYPLAAERLELRAKHYNEGVALARKYREEGKVMIVSPDDTCGVGTLTRNVESIKQLYEKGYSDGKTVAPFVKRKM